MNKNESVIFIQNEIVRVRVVFSFVKLFLISIRERNSLNNKNNNENAFFSCSSFFHSVGIKIAYLSLVLQSSATVFFIEKSAECIVPCIFVCSLIYFGWSTVFVLIGDWTLFLFVTSAVQKNLILLNSVFEKQQKCKSSLQWINNILYNSLSNEKGTNKKL